MRFCHVSFRLLYKQAYHQYECRLDLARLRQTDTKSSFRVFMALRAVLQRPKEFFLDNWSW